MRNLVAVALLGLFVGSLPAQLPPTWVQQSGLAEGVGRMVWDDHRQRLVLFGTGLNSVPGSNSTWERTNRWVDRSAGAQPRAVGAMTYDPVRQVVLQFGGRLPGAMTVYTNDTWTYDGNTWRLLSTVGAPFSGAAIDMQWDNARGLAVLFGSSIGTWEWDGATWAQRFAPGSPAVQEFSMTYDSVRQQTLLAGRESTGGTRLWDWDGTTWTAVPQSLVPVPAPNLAVAFDTVRARVVMTSVRSATNTVWEWDGSTWQQGPRGPMYAVHALAFDPSIGKCVALGRRTQEGASMGTFAWNGAVWSELEPERWPGSRVAPTVAYDASRQRVVLFAGATGGSIFGAQYSSDLYEWDGLRWELMAQGGAAPSGSGSARLVHDARNDEMLLYDGWFGTVRAWDGATWTQRSSTGAPMFRSGSGLAYDAARGRLVLFGGYGGFPLAETWEWDGAVWVQRNPAETPPARGEPSMVYDSARRVVVMFGGRAATGADMNDVWEWDGVTWREASPANTPPPSRGVGMVFDSVRARTVLHTGQQVWEWDGRDWVQVPVVGPAAGHSSAMAFDSARNVAVSYLFWDQQASSSISETWLYGRTTAAAATKVLLPCPQVGLATELVPVGVPVLGSDSFRLDFVPASPGALAGGLSAVLLGDSLAATALGSCTVRIPLLPATPLVLARQTPTGFVSVPLAVPSTSALLGASLYVQGVSVLPGPVRFDTTSTLEVRLGV